MFRKRLGSGIVSGIFIVFIAIVAMVVVVDLYRVYDAYTWAYNLAGEASWMGSSKGRDWSTYADSGYVSLDYDTAYSTAITRIERGMTRRGFTDYSTDIRVITHRNDGSPILGFPPNSRLVHLGSDWSSIEPAVGVYIRLGVELIVLPGQTVYVSAFGSSAVEHTN